MSGDRGGPHIDGRCLLIKTGKAEDCQTVFEEVMPERCVRLTKSVEEEGEAAREVVVSPSMPQGMGVRAEFIVEVIASSCLPRIVLLKDSLRYGPDGPGLILRLSVQDGLPLPRSPPSDRGPCT
jgi:hypothetical protein